MRNAKFNEPEFRMIVAIILTFILGILVLGTEITK